LPNFLRFQKNEVSTIIGKTSHVKGSFIQNATGKKTLWRNGFPRRTPKSVSVSFTRASTGKPSKSNDKSIEYLTEFMADRKDGEMLPGVTIRAEVAKETGKGITGV